MKVDEIKDASEAELYRTLLTPDGDGVRVKSAALAELIARARHARGLEIKRME